MKLEDALKQNPYDKTRGSKGAYIRYLRYTVDGWYSKKSEEMQRREKPQESEYLPLWK